MKKSFFSVMFIVVASFASAASAKEVIDLTKSVQANDSNPRGTEVFSVPLNANKSLDFLHVFYPNKPKYNRLHGILIGSYCEEERDVTLNKYFTMLKLISNNFNIKGAAKGKDVLIYSICVNTNTHTSVVTNGIALLINSLDLAKINTRLGDAGDPAADVRRAEGLPGKKPALVYPYRAIMLGARAVNYESMSVIDFSENAELTALWKKKVSEREVDTFEEFLEKAYQQRAGQ